MFSSWRRHLLEANVPDNEAHFGALFRGNMPRSTSALGLGILCEFELKYTFAQSSWFSATFSILQYCNANIEIGQPSKSTLGGSWKWCSERTRPSCPRRGKDNCGFQSRIKIFSTFSKNFWKINLQIFVRFARKDVFSFDCDIFGQHVAGGNIYLCPRAFILLN